MGKRGIEKKCFTDKKSDDTRIAYIFFMRIFSYCTIHFQVMSFEVNDSQYREIIFQLEYFSVPDKCS